MLGLEENRRHEEKGEGYHAGEAEKRRNAEAEGNQTQGEGAAREDASRKEHEYENIN